MAVTVDSFKMVVEEVLPGLQRAEEVLAIIGLLYVGKLTLATVWDIAVGLRAFLWSRLWRKKLVERYGSWAVVTGSTDGIGKAYAHELAKAGVNIVLISRTLEKLVKVAQEIEEQHGVQTHIIQADFSVGQSVYDSIADELAGKEIGILVNNVGIMLPYPMAFCDVSEPLVWGHVNVNVASVPAMSRIVLPEMLKRKKGAIINIASIAARGPIPYLGIYAASKAFVEYFSKAMKAEHGGSGITIQTITPGYVSTNMTSYSPWVHTPGLFIPTASSFSASALSSLGYTSVTCGYWSHGIQAWFVDKFCPEWLWILTMKLLHLFLIKTARKPHNS